MGGMNDHALLGKMELNGTDRKTILIFMNKIIIYDLFVAIFLSSCFVFCSCSLDDSFFELDDVILYEIAESPEYAEYALIKQSITNILYQEDTLEVNDSNNDEFMFVRKIDLSSSLTQLSEAKFHLINRFPEFDKYSFNEKQYILYLASTKQGTISSGIDKHFTRTVATNPESVVVSVLRQIQERYSNQYNIQAYTSFSEDILNANTFGSGFIFTDHGGEPCVHFLSTSIPPTYIGFTPSPDKVYFYADIEENCSYRFTLNDSEKLYSSELKNNCNLKNLRIYLIQYDHSIFEYYL